MRYQFRRGKTAEWNSNDPQLAAGEMGLEYTTTANGDVIQGVPPRIKIGAFGSEPNANANDNFKWGNLPYLQLGGSSSGGADSATPGSGSALVRSAAGIMYYSDVLKINNSATDTSGSMNIKGAVIPTIPDTFSLGSTGARWSNIYMNAAGSVNLGYTTLTDTSGALTLSGPIIPKTDAATLGTAAKPWKQMHIGSNQMKASGNDLAIELSDSYEMIDSTYGNTIATVLGLTNINDIAVSENGKMIVAVDLSSVYICTDGLGKIFTKIYTLTESGTLKKCSVSGNGQYIFVSREYIQSNSTYIKIIRITNGVALQLPFTGPAGYSTAFLETSYLGNVIALSTTDSSSILGKLYVSRNYGQNFNGGESGLNSDNTPTLEAGRLLDMWLSSDGNRIYISQKISLTPATTTIKTYNITFGIAWNSILDLSEGAFPTRIAKCDDPSITAYATGFITDSDIPSQDGFLAKPTTIIIKKDIIKTNIGASLNWNKLKLSNNGKYLIGIAGSTVYSFVIEYGSQQITAKYSNSILIPNITSLSKLVLSGDGTRRIVSHNTGSISIGIDPYININRKIGIGTTVPGARLEIANPIAEGESSALMVRNSGTTTGQSVSTSFATDATTTANAKILVDGSANAAMRFFTTTNGVLTEKMSVDKNGLVVGGALLTLSSNPIGTINMFCSITNLPSGWLLCNGQELTCASYPELFNIIGTSFGTPSVNTKFKIPDMSGKFPTGFSAVRPLGSYGGSTSYTPTGTIGGTALTIDQMPEHSHGITQTPHTHRVRLSIPLTNTGGNGGGIEYDSNSYGTDARANIDTESGSFVENGITYGKGESTAAGGATTSLMISHNNAIISINNQGSGYTHTHTFTGTSATIVPPYIGLAYIIYTGRTTQ